MSNFCGNNKPESYNKQNIEPWFPHKSWTLQWKENTEESLHRYHYGHHNTTSHANITKQQFGWKGALIVNITSKDTEKMGTIKWKSDFYHGPDWNN